MDTQDLFVGIVAPAQWGSALLGRWAIAAEWQDDVVPPACGINHVWRERNARSQRIRSAVPECDDVGATENPGRFDLGKRWGHNGSWLRYGGRFSVGQGHEAQEEACSGDCKRNLK